MADRYKIATQDRTEEFTNKTLTSPVLNDFTGTGGTVTVADEGNTVGITITQNDVTNNKIGATIVNAGTGNGLFIDQNGNGVALNIDSEATTAKTLTIASAAATSGVVLEVSASSASFTANLTKLLIGNANATGRTLAIQNEGTGNGLLIDQNGNATALSIDTEVANDGMAMNIAVAGTSPQPFTVYRNDDVTGNVVLRLGSGYLWVDTTGDLRVHTAQPTSDTGGTVVGTQT